MAHIVKTSFYEGNTLHSAGEAFVHDDAEYLAKVIADGNVVDSEDEDTRDPAAEAEAARLATLQAEEAARHNPVPPSAPVSSDEDPKTLTPPAPVASQPQPGVTALTPEQLAQDFQGAGAQTSPVVPPQL